MCTWPGPRNRTARVVPGLCRSALQLQRRLHARTAANLARGHPDRASRFRTRSPGALGRQTWCGSARGIPFTAIEISMTSRSAAQTFLMQVRETLRQAWPVLISAWASMAFGVMDTAMAGHASAADLQAMSLAVSIYITIFVGLMGVIHALIPIIGQHYGAQRLLEVGRAWGQGVWLSMGLSALGAIAMLFPDAWLSLSGDVDPAVRNGVTWYLRALILALPAALAFRAIYALGTAVSRPKVVMTINLAAIVVKGVFNWVFIFGKLGAPALGAAGAGLSTAITSWFSLAAGLWIMRHDGFFR